MRKISITYFFFVFQFYNIGAASAQFPHLYFENITTDDGLSSNTITCLYQDKKGFLWVGTTNGLNRYDGNIFQKFYHEEGNKNSISGNSIVAILEDDAGVFWIATKDGGLTRYDPGQMKDKQFKQIKYDPEDSASLPSNRMTAILSLDENYLLFSTESMSLGFLNKKTFEITYSSFKYEKIYKFSINPAQSQKKNSGNNWVQHFASDENYVYVSLLGGGCIYIFDRNTYQLLTPELESHPGSIHFFDVSEKNIWFATWNKGLYTQENYAPGMKMPLQYKTVLDIPDEVTHITSWDEKTLLAATRNSGVYLLDKKSYNFEKLLHNRSDNNSIASNRVICMLKDRDNILWLGTNEGLSKYNPLQWQFTAKEVTPDYSKQINHFSLYDDGEILRICTDNGMYKKKHAGNTFIKNDLYYENVKIEPTQIYLLQNGKYILNTENASYWYDPGKETIRLLDVEHYYTFFQEILYKKNPLERGNYQVRDMITDTINGNPVFIFATLGWGMGIYDLKEDVFYDFVKTSEKTIQNNMTRVLFRDAQKEYWVGTSEGLYKWKKSFPFKNEFEQFLNDADDTTSVSGNSITGMYQDKQGTYWITTNNGLNAFDGKKFVRYKPAYKQSNFMYGIHADKNENLWIAVPDGFEIFNLQTKTFQHIALPNKEWALKYPAQILKTEKGEWLYGAGNNLISFSPAAYVFESTFPEIYLTGFSVFDEELFQTSAFSNLKFKHNNNFFTITFSSLQLSQPATVKYQYQLNGLNDEWVDLNNTGKIEFTSLPPGKYRLYTKVTNPQGSWSDAKELVTFSVSAPYWQQGWFFVVCTLFVGFCTYAFIKYREKQFLQMQTMRNKIANDLHDDVGSALSTINLYSEVAKMKTSEEDIELKTILNKISDTSIEMQENMSHIVWSLQPRNDTFEQIILRLKRYAVENLQAKNIHTEFTIDEKLHELKLSQEKRKELFLIYKEALHNIQKYAGCSLVKIKFTKTNQMLEMHISDNGAGFKQDEKFAGNGLHTMQERAQALHGKLKVTSQQGEGTSVRLRFPL